jgi:S1-C subfamily serine protease
MSCGVISGPNRQGIGFNSIEDFIQTDAAVNPGASGGALVNADGQLIGMIAAIFTKDADIDAGVNFAISTQLLIERLKQFEMR